MKYMLLIYSQEANWTEQERIECMTESAALCARWEEEGVLIAADPLEPVETATCVNKKEGRTLITDGPFAETHEQLGGYYIVDVADLDVAIAMAKQLPPVSKGTVEIRPITEIPQLNGGQ